MLLASEWSPKDTSFVPTIILHQIFSQGVSSGAHTSFKPPGAIQFIGAVTSGTVIVLVRGRESGSFVVKEAVACKDKNEIKKLDIEKLISIVTPYGNSTLTIHSH